MAQPPSAPSSFLNYYNEAPHDEYNRDYALLMQVFAVLNGQNLAASRDLTTNNPESSSIGYVHLYLVDPQNPAGPGMLQVTHNMACHHAVWANQ
jgi:hypothetical protein